MTEFTAMKLPLVREKIMMMDLQVVSLRQYRNSWKSRDITVLIPEITFCLSVSGSSVWLTASSLVSLFSKST